jgi:hypothetical protein
MTPDRSQLPTIGHIRALGMSGFALDCLGVHCHHSARIEFDALQLPDDLILIDIPPALRLRQVWRARGERSAGLAAVFRRRRAAKISERGLGALKPGDQNETDSDGAPPLKMAPQGVCLALLGYFLRLGRL